MSLAEATAALSKKDEEKNAVLDEIQKLEDLQTEGIVAVLNGCVYGLKVVPENRIPTFTYRHYHDDSNDHTAEHADQALADAVRVHLAEKKGRFSISCKLAHDGAGSEEPLPDLIYTAEVSLNEIPEDTELRTEITATLEGAESDGVDSSIVMNLKASIDDIASMIVSKTVALEQVQQEFDAIVAQVQEAKKKPAAKTGKAKGTKKAAAPKKKLSNAGSRSRETIASEEEEAAAEAAPQSSMLTDLTEKAAAAWEVVKEKRAFVLFPLAAAVIYMFGDYASV